MTAAELQERATEHAKEIGAHYRVGNGELSAGVLVVLVDGKGGYGVATNGLKLEAAPDLLRRLADDVDGRIT